MGWGKDGRAIRAESGDRCRECGGGAAACRRQAGQKEPRLPERRPKRRRFSSFPILSGPAAIVNFSAGNNTKWIPRGMGGCALCSRAQSGMMPLGSIRVISRSKPHFLLSPSLEMRHRRNLPSWSCCLCGLAPWRESLVSLSAPPFLAETAFEDWGSFGRKSRGLHPAGTGVGEAHSVSLNPRVKLGRRVLGQFGPRIPRKRWRKLLMQVKRGEG